MMGSTTSGKAAHGRIFRGKYARVVKKLAIAAFWLGVWQFVYLRTGREILVVSPLSVAKRIFELGAEWYFWRNIGATMLRITLGFALGTLTGAALAVLAAAYGFIGELFAPLVQVIKATPVASFTLLALVWLKTGTIPVFISVLIVFPIVYANLFTGIKKTAPELLTVAKAFRFGKIKTTRLIYIPSVKPYLGAALAAGFGLAWKAGVAAEVLCIPKYSVGTMLRDARVYLETLDLFAWTAVVIILSVLTERIIKLILTLNGSKSI